MKTFLLMAVSFYLMISSVEAQWIKTNGPGYSSIYNLEVFGNSLFASSTTKGVLRSTDEGDHWEEYNGGLSILNAWCFGVRDTTIFVGTPDGLFYSNKSDNFWRPTGLVNFGVTRLAFKKTHIFAAIGNRGVFVSSDNGQTWKSNNFGLSDTNIYGFLVVDTNLFAATQLGGVFISSNNGENWSAVNSGLPKKTPVYALASMGKNIFMATNKGVYLSTNNGQQWINMLSNMPTPYINAIIAVDSNLIVGTFGLGTFTSSNGGVTWSDFNGGSSEPSNIYSLAMNDKFLFMGANDLPGYVWKR